MDPLATEPLRALQGSTKPLVENYDCAMLDLDGVVYVGGKVIAGVPEVLKTARAQRMHLAFVTNNASRTPEAVAAELCGLGIPAEPDDVVTSAQAAAREVARRVPAGSPVLVIGGEGLVAALSELGLEPVTSSAQSPAAVVQGFGPDVGWRQLAEGAVAIRAGAVWVVSNTDLTIPTASGLAPGNGAFVNALAAAVGVEPAVVAGKPHRPLFDETTRRVGSRRPLVVGDRLDTDIEGATACGADSLLVMTGVTDLPTLGSAANAERPTYVAWSLQGLLTQHQAPTRAGERWCLAGWSASVSDSRVRLDSRGTSPDDGLRVVTAAAWAALDADSTVELRWDDIDPVFASLT